jgi:hypothetical protein
MKKVLFLAIVIYLLAAGYLYVQSANNPCEHVLSYSIGSFDPRFGITQDQFRAYIESAEAIWEKPLDRELFQYDPRASFKINLIFDDRQQKTLDERDLKQNIDTKEQSYDQVVGQYNSLAYQHQQDLDDYNAQKAEYDSRLQKYNDQVTYWNQQGGAPADEYEKLNDEKNALQKISADLETKRTAVNKQATDLNALSDTVNELAKKLNIDVDNYNGKFGDARQFDQGIYTGDSIDIYQFNEEADLKLVLAHELGHALHLEHVNDPKAIMYYLMDKQDIKNTQLTETDLAAIKNQCHIN